MDVPRDMSAFQTCSFDVVIDKGIGFLGTLDSLLCGNNSQTKCCQDAERSLEVTYGAPMYGLRLLKESCIWRIKLHVIEKLLLGGVFEQPMWELTNPVLLDDDGSSVEAALGKNSDVHYIYICAKDESLRPDQEHEVS